MSNTLGFFISILYFLGVFFIALKINEKNTEVPRLFIHIMSANWYILAQIIISDKLVALSIPALLYLFHLINNYILIFPKIISSSKSSRFGSLYTYLAMMLLIYFTYDTAESQLIAGVGILSLGYGDAIASFVGMQFGKHQFTIFKGSKSIEGSISMFVSVILVLSFYLGTLNNISAFNCILAVALLSTITEAISPYGLDNLFIPILSSLLYAIWLF